MTRTTALAAVLALVGPAGLAVAQHDEHNPGQQAAAGDAAPREAGAAWCDLVECSANQTVLAQRMTKELLLIAAGEAPAENRDRLTASIAAFDGALESLRFGTGGACVTACVNERIARQLSDNDARWTELRPVMAAVAAGRNPDRSVVEFVADKTPLLLRSVEVTARLVQARAGESLGLPGRELSFASRQATLTQQMTADFLLVHLNVRADRARESLADGMARFDTMLAALAEGDEALGVDAVDSPAVEVVRQQWPAFKASLAGALGETPSAADVRRVSALSDAMFASASRVVAALQGSFENAVTLTHVQDPQD